MRRLAGPLWARVGFTAVLEVPGRRTGAPRQVTVFPIEVDGTWYLLSQYGACDWVRNLRAAGGGKLRRRGRTEAFGAIEVEGDERDWVIAAFRKKVPKSARVDFERLPTVTDHPTFRLEWLLR